MTPAQTLILAALAQTDRPRSAGQLAREAWPDDPGWDKWTAGRGASSFNGCKGGTMPLRAGRVLRALEDAGLVRLYGEDRLASRQWVITERGRQALASTT